MEAAMDAFEPAKPEGDYREHKHSDNTKLNDPYYLSKDVHDKPYDHRHAELEEVWDTRSDPKTPLGKRKASECDRQPESPPDVERQHAPNRWNREKHFHPESMDTDSPASYPKHVMVPDQRYPRDHYDGIHSKDSVSTPVLSNEPGMHGGYEHPSYRPSNQYQEHGYGHDGGHYHGHTPPRQSRHYLPEMETSPPYPPQPEAWGRPRRWACDYCNVATFVSYEEACAHEDACARQYHERYGGRPHPSRGPIPQYDRAPPPPQQQQPGLGALYHASQEVGPPMGRQQMWGRPGPPMPHLPPNSHYGSPHHHHVPPPHHPYNSPPRYNGYHGYDGRDSGSHSGRDHSYRQAQKRVLLAMPTDADSLSDRQCYVRSEMVEIFAASGKDVSARHSKGAQKLVEGQVGIRCVHCSHLRPRDRAERAVCYPSSISRIYQTVADMQRFHFEQCREIPQETRKIYRSLKTTRPRGVGSPQTYWIQSAKLLDLVDTEDGIRFSGEMNKETTESSP